VTKAAVADVVCGIKNARPAIRRSLRPVRDAIKDCCTVPRFVGPGAVRSSPCAKHRQHFHTVHGSVMGQDIFKQADGGRSRRPGHSTRRPPTRRDVSPQCDVHGWMKAYSVVNSTRRSFFGSRVCRRRGSRLKDLPAGDYTLVRRGIPRSHQDYDRRSAGQARRCPRGRFSYKATDLNLHVRDRRASTPPPRTRVASQS